MQRDKASATPMPPDATARAKMCDPQKGHDSQVWRHHHTTYKKADPGPGMTTADEKGVERKRKEEGAFQGHPKQGDEG